MPLPFTFLKDLKLTPHLLRRFALFLIVFGIAAKFYGLADPWKTNDHYNHGGVWTTVFVECLKMTPLDVSKGVPHHNCWNNDPKYYRAHPPTLIFAVKYWTDLFGTSEAAFRLFTLLFSTLNIGLVFLIARASLKKSSLAASVTSPSKSTRAPGSLDSTSDRTTFPLLAAAMQSVFLGNMYFGTHLDFICEFAVTFVLLAAWLALSGRIYLAGLAGLAAGITAWPGYIVFAPLFAYTLLTKRGRIYIFALGAVGFALALGMMMWLHQSTDIIEFLRMKLLNPGYVKKGEKGLLEPMWFITNFFRSQARLLSPPLAAFALYELWFGDGRELITQARNRFRDLTPFHHAIILSGGTGLLYAFLGHEYFMVHVFLYLLFTPALALLAARFIERAILAPAPITPTQKRWFIALAFTLTALYPYGIFKSAVVHDALNSLVIIGASLWLMWKIGESNLTAKSVLTVTAIAAGFNISQTVNYRNEPDTERSFCEQARAEYARTQAPVHTKENYSFAKDFIYCRRIPIVYEGEVTK